MQSARPAYASGSFSDKVCSTMAVEDSEAIMPRTNATAGENPNQIRMIETLAVVRTTCAPPMPNSLCRISHNDFGSSSSPIRNSISTTPNSAKCCKSAVSAPAMPKIGPIRIPAAR
jgi:hypothetical protein